MYKDILSAIVRGLPWKRQSFRPTQAYYINLDKRVDRRVFMEKQLASLDIPSARWPAVQLASLSGTIWDGVLGERGVASYVMGGGNPLPTIGCYLSHVSLLEHIAQNGSPQSLIFEDDICIATGFFEAARRLAQRLPLYDIVLFDCFGSRRPRDRIDRDIYRPTRTYPDYHGSHALLIPENGAERILSKVCSKQIMDIDGLYLRKAELLCFVVYTGLLRSGGFRSDRHLPRP